jgi:Fur family transcriptional regulator, ferric uptake regulator
MSAESRESNKSAGSAEIEPAGLAAEAATSDELRERLRDAGFRLTPQRRLVLQAVVELGHSTPEEICQRVQATADGVNVSTIYRTLDVLEQIGLVRHTHLGHGAPTYHAAEDANHVHLVCHACGSVIDAPIGVADPLAGTLRDAYAFELDVQHFAIYGTCADCAGAPAGG